MGAFKLSSPLPGLTFSHSGAVSSHQPPLTYLYHDLNHVRIQEQFVRFDMIGAIRTFQKHETACQASHFTYQNPIKFSYPKYPFLVRVGDVVLGTLCGMPPTIIAARLEPFGTSIFAEMSRLAVEYKAINLAQGFPDFDGPEHVKQAAIDAINAGHGQYARMFGVPLLNEAIAGWYRREASQSINPDTQITVTAGCTEAIAACMLGLLNPGDEVILFEPYYDSYRACVAMAGATPRFVTLRAPDFTFDEAELRRAFTPRTKLILVNTPQNPTGRVFTRAELSLIAELCQKHDIVALADEVYERLVYEGEHLRLATFPGMEDRTVTLSSLGKTFSLTGWKIGWAVTTPELSKGIRAAHQFLTFAVSTPMQHAAAVALNSPPSYYDEFLAGYRRKRDFLAGALREIGFALTPPQGSYFIYADHTPISARLGGGGGMDDVAFCKHMIEKIGVAAIPPTSFYENKDEGKKLVRFAFCKKDETLRGAAERLRGLAG